MRLTPVILVAALVALVSIRLLPFAEDDAYIHFRIAENLAEHGKPYFNPDECVMATSSLVWTCVLTSLTFIPLPLPLLACLLNAGLTVIGAWLWAGLLCKTLENPLPFWAIWLFRLLYIGLLLPSSAGLMETPLAMLLMAWSCLLLVNDRCAGWVALAVAIFTRLEFVVLVPLFAVPLFLARKGRVLPHVLCFAGPVIALSSLSWILFSTVIPHTAVAKQIVYTLSRQSVFQNVFYDLLPPLHYSILGFPFTGSVLYFASHLLSWAWIPGFCAFLGVACCAMPWRSFLKDERQRWVPCMGLAGVMIAAAYILKHVFVHPWYVPLFSVPILFFFFGTSQSLKVSRIAILALAVLPLCAVNEYSFAATGDTRMLTTSAAGARVQRYREVGAILYRVFPDARLMTSEIGGLGYGFKGKLLDGAGLISPGALPYHPIRGSDSGIGGIPAQFVRQEDPELIVSYPVFLREFETSPIRDRYRRFSIPAFSAGYTLRTGVSGVFDCDHLDIYVRNDLANEDTARILTDALGATPNPLSSAGTKR